MFLQDHGATQIRKKKTEATQNYTSAGRTEQYREQRKSVQDNHNSNKKILQDNTQNSRQKQ